MGLGYGFAALRLRMRYGRYGVGRGVGVQRTFFVFGIEPIYACFVHFRPHSRYALPISVT